MQGGGPVLLPHALPAGGLRIQSLSGWRDLERPTTSLYRYLKPLQVYVYVFKVYFHDDGYL